MKILKAVLFLVIILLAAFAAAWYSYEQVLETRDICVRQKLAENGITIHDLQYKKDTLIIILQTSSQTVTSDDIMLIRKTLNALRNIVFDEKIYYITLKDPTDKIIYSDVFYNIYSYSDIIKIEYSGGTLDEVMKKYLLRYDMNKKGFSCEYIGFYETVGMKEKALFVEIAASPSNLAEAVKEFIYAVTALNEKGSAVYRHSAAFYDEDGTVMAVVSRDVVYGDVIYWKSPAYSSIKTMFG